MLQKLIPQKIVKKYDGNASGSFRVSTSLVVVELNESQPNRGQGTRLVDAKHVEGREARDFFAWKNCGNFGGKKTSLTPCKMRSEMIRNPEAKKVEPDKAMVGR